MDRDVLFGRTLSELRQRLDAGRRDEYEAMAIAGLLRKLLVDAEPLVDQVNRTRRLKLRFQTSLPKSTSSPDLPEPPPPGAPPFVRGIKTLTKEELLSRLAVWSAPHEFTVKDVIRYVANIKGGVHAGRPRDAREATLVATGSRVRIGGFDPSVYALFGIAEIVLSGVEPLRRQVEMDLAAKNPAPE